MFEFLEQYCSKKNIVRIFRTILDKKKFCCNFPINIGSDQFHFSPRNLGPLIKNASPSNFMIKSLLGAHHMLFIEQILSTFKHFFLNYFLIDKLANTKKFFWLAIYYRKIDPKMTFDLKDPGNSVEMTFF